MGFHCSDVPKVVEHVNSVIQARVRARAGREPTTAPTPGPRLSVRSEAARRGDEVPPVQGIQHKRSAEYELRGDARCLASQAQELERQWWQAWRHERPGYDEADWQRRVERAKEEAATAWAHAEEVSDNRSCLACVGESVMASPSPLTLATSQGMAEDWR